MTKANVTTLLRFGKRLNRNRIFTKVIRRKRAVSADEIARLADRGQDVSKFFTNRGQMMGPIRRVNVDFASPVLAELDRAAEDLNVSRQAAATAASSSKRR